MLPQDTSYECYLILGLVARKPMVYFLFKSIAFRLSYSVYFE